MINKADILNKLNIKAFYSSEVPSLKLNGSMKAMALCPLHDDTNPSLSVDLKTGQWKCHGCEQSGSIFDFYMKKNGTDYKTAFNALAAIAGLSTGLKMKIIQTYDYTDEAGKLIFQVCRYEPKDFRQRRPDGKGGWIWKMEGIELVLFNLPAVVPVKSVIIVEGEKDVLSLKGMGLVASCNAQGAGKWRDEYKEYFKGKRVVILPDNDEAGRNHALQVARSLHGVAESIKIVALPDLPEKGDVSDWIHKGGTREKLLELIKEAPENDLSELSDIEAGHLDNVLNTPFPYLKRGADLQLLECVILWCINQLLPKESITLLHGRGGIGKTWLCLILAYCVSRGLSFMGLDALKMPVVFIDFENSLPVLIDRIRKIGIEDVLFWHNADEILRPPKLDSVEWEGYKKLPAGSLLIFDTLRAAQNLDENDSRGMAFIMSRLKELRDMGFTILLLHHTPKSNDRTYKGSTAIQDQADHVLSLHKVRKGNPEGGEIDDEDETDCLYRLGTKDKTRYEPFHIFMNFDKERGFIKADDPDDVVLQDIQDFLKDSRRLNQNSIFEIAKNQLDIRSKGKVINLLKKGEGKYWTSHKEGRAVYYQALGPVLLSTPIYQTNRQVIDTPFGTVQTDAGIENLQGLDNSQLSNCPDPDGTDRTDPINCNEKGNCNLYKFLLNPDTKDLQPWCKKSQRWCEK